MTRLRFVFFHDAEDPKDSHLGLGHYKYSLLSNYFCYGSKRGLAKGSTLLGGGVRAEDPRCHVHTGRG